MSAEPCRHQWATGRHANGYGLHCSVCDILGTIVPREPAPTSPAVPSGEALERLIRAEVEAAIRYVTERWSDDWTGAVETATQRIVRAAILEHARKVRPEPPRNRAALEAVRTLLDWNTAGNEFNCADDPNWQGVAAAREYADATLEDRTVETWAIDELRKAQRSLHERRTGGEEE